jgi:hypothetical protein
VNFVHECAGGESYVDFVNMTGEEAGEFEAFLERLQPDVSDVSVLPIPPPPQHTFAQAMVALKSHFLPEDERERDAGEEERHGRVEADAADELEGIE